MSSEVYEYVCENCDRGIRINLPAPPYHCAWCGVQFPPSDRTYYASQNGGRSKGVLHTSRDCRHLKNVPDELIVEGDRERFAEDQPVCGTCGGDAL
jgi:DNA-directed RNA polymerase subunit RPC12/RpoP